MTISQYRFLFLQEMVLTIFFLNLVKNFMVLLEKKLTRYGKETEAG